MASAIKIGAPVSYARARRVIREERHRDAGQRRGDIGGEGGDRQSGHRLRACVGGVGGGSAPLVGEGVIGEGERVVCVLTGNILKDPDTTISYHMDDTDEEKSYVNRPVVVGGELGEIRRTIESYL